MCDDCRMTASEKIRRLPWYCEMLTARHVRSVIGFSGLDWTKICANLKKEYKDRDIAQQISSRTYLEVFKSKPRTENAEVLQFCRDYSEISKELLEKGKLDKYTQLRWFLQGLPSSIQSKLINHYDIDLDGDALPDFAEILKKAYSLIETRKRMAELGTTDIKNDRISDLVDWHAKNDQLEHPFSGPSKLSNSAFQVPVVSAPPLISTSFSQNEKKIDHLTDMFQSLALSVRTLQGNSAAPPILSQPRAQPANTSSESRMRTNYRGEDAGKTRPEGATKCMYCWETDHYLKRHCQVFQDDLNSSRIHLGDEGKVCLGPYKPGVRPVYMRREKPGRESVADAEKLRYPSLPPANVQTLRIGELEPDPYSSDEEYISLDAPIDGIEVLAARTNQSSSTKEPSKEPVKRILRRRIEKEKEYAAPKNVCFGEWESVRESSAPASAIPASSVAPETAMPDADNASTTRKSVEKRKHPRVVNVLKESVGATTITKRILDLGVSLTVGELLASAPAVEKQLTKAISEDEAVQFRVNTLGSAEVLEAPTSYSWYSMGSPKAKVRLEDGSKVTALLDTGAEINVMTKELMEDANLAMRRGPKLELVSHTGHSRPFLGLCEDVEVAIGGLKTRHPIFVVEAGDHDLVLGQPFLNSMKFN